MEGWHYVLFDASHLGFGEMILGYFKFNGHAKMFADMFNNEHATVHTVPGMPQELIDLPEKMRKFNTEQALKQQNNNIRVHDEVFLEDDEWYEEDR